ncbi:beta-eliminating lyase-related protein [Microlunatus antarcticus]|uniref:beta-eliminating lyase-related protein n=1 Tax=Microlunatus antarcticus TaxID=53388 RepID=UPI002FCCC7F8
MPPSRSRAARYVGRGRPRRAQAAGPRRPGAGRQVHPELVEREAWGWGDDHRAQPLAVSRTQSTELGTVYSPDEIRAVADLAHSHGMAVHLDEARIWNAAAGLGLSFAAFTSEVGVDVLTFGGTKNGLLGTEAVVVLEPARASGLVYLRMLTMQLTSKMRWSAA